MARWSRYSVRPGSPDADADQRDPIGKKASHQSVLHLLRSFVSSGCGVIRNASLRAGIRVALREAEGVPDQPTESSRTPLYPYVVVTPLGGVEVRVTTALLRGWLPQTPSPAGPTASGPLRGPARRGSRPPPRSGAPRARIPRNGRERPRPLAGATNRDSAPCRRSDRVRRRSGRRGRPGRRGPPRAHRARSTLRCTRPHRGSSHQQASPRLDAAKGGKPYRLTERSPTFV